MYIRIKNNILFVDYILFKTKWKEYALQKITSEMNYKNSNFCFYIKSNKCSTYHIFSLGTRMKHVLYRNKTHV